VAKKITRKGKKAKKTIKGKKVGYSSRKKA
jgi:hypothetical protein